MSDAQAQQTAVNGGLRVRFVKSPSDTVAMNHVIRQNPPAGTKVDPNSLVELVVSNGKPTVGLMDARGFTGADAQRILQHLGFAVTVVHQFDSTLKDTVIEPFEKGRWYQVGEDGSTCENGFVLAWEPPHRLVLAWQINGNWQFDPDLVTEVEVKFIAEGERKTRVELEHRHLERMGATAEAGRAAVDSPNGWGAILELFRQAAEAGSKQ